MEKLTIVGLRLDHRQDIAPEVQEILTRHGDRILCRMGLPDPGKQDGIYPYMRLHPGIEEFGRTQAIQGVKVSYMTI